MQPTPTPAYIACFARTESGSRSESTATPLDALYTITSPNATRPRVTSRSRWYSTGATCDGRPRRLGGSSAPGGLAREPPEGVAPLLVVAELVEARAGGRQQPRVARL